MSDDGRWVVINGIPKFIPAGLFMQTVERHDPEGLPADIRQQADALRAAEKRWREQ